MSVKIAFCLERNSMCLNTFSLQFPVISSNSSSYNLLDISGQIKHPSVCYMFLKTFAVVVNYFLKFKT